ncbi:hypothetical protein D3C87_1803030 [compost metagenome]
MLDGDDAARGEAGAVADAVHLVDDRHGRVAGAHEIGVQRVHVAAFVDGALGRDQGLADHLAAEHALPSDLGTAATKQVLLELFEVECGKQRIHGRCGLSGARHFGCLRW